jgi:predicted acetyltransferase
MAEDPKPGHRHWDARWDSQQRAAAVRLARNDLQARLDAVQRATDEVTLAADWVTSISYFKARADAREVGVK